MLGRVCTGIFAIACLTILSCAHGGSLFFEPEVEPNDSLLNPQIITPFPALPHGSLGHLTVPATLTPGDVDFFQVEFTHLIAAFDASDGGPVGNPPSLVAVFDSTGTMLSVSSVGGILVGMLSPGTYTFAITAAPDFGFTGAHSQSFSYGLSLSWVVIPAPASLAFFGAACLGYSRRRRLRPSASASSAAAEGAGTRTKSS